MVDLVRNIDLLQINIKAGVSEYYLPKNVSWRDKVIDRLCIVTDEDFDNPNRSTIYSPIDKVTPVLKFNDVINMYADLYTADSKEIAHGLSISNIIFENNNPWEPNTVLDLQQSRLFFSTPPTKSGCILIYVFYDGRTVDAYEPSSKTITTRFALQPGQEISFANIINTYVHVDYQKIRSIQFINAEDNPAFVTFRDYALSYIINKVPNFLMRVPSLPPLTGGIDALFITQEYPMLFDEMDIDFSNSFILNGMREKVSEQVITFEY